MSVLYTRIFKQLDDDTLALLKERVSVVGSRAAVARELGYSRASISMLLDRKYPHHTHHLRAKIIELYASRIACPHQRIDIPPRECRALREMTMAQASASPSDVAQWRACQACPNNPARISSGGDV